MPEVHVDAPTEEAPQGLVVRMVGEAICDTTLLKGYNTYVRSRQDPDTGAVSAAIVAAACGVVETTDRVVSIRTMSARYVAEVGDVIVGRITDVLPGRWLADVGSSQHASMLLSNVTEPGGMLRRRGRDDELSMRRIFMEGDVFAAEVQRVSPDGFISLHTRSAQKYGRLVAEGTCVPVHAALVRRVKHHFHAFPFGVSVIIGTNGRIWVQRTTAASLEAMQPAKHPSARDADDDASAAAAGSSETYVLEDDLEARMAVTRVVNCLHVLSRAGLAIETATIAAAVRCSTLKQLKPYDILSGDYDVVLASAARAARD
jgi:exosome complex component RRP4